MQELFDAVQLSIGREKLTKRYAYVEPQFNQLLFNQAWNWLEQFKNKVKWIAQRSDELVTVKAIEKKYSIKLRWGKINDGAWEGWIVQ